MAVRAAGHRRSAVDALRHGYSQLPAILRRCFLLVHPPKVRARALGFRHTYYLGAAAASIWLVMIATGMLMMFHVTPAVPDIYHDLKELQFTVEYGGLVRNMHRWGASAMVMVVFLHLLRVFFHRAYGPPRRQTWFMGVGLFVLIFLSAHTGYLLPWDQRAYWGISIAVTMAEQMPFGDEVRLLLLGGNSIGRNAVRHFYVLHCVLIPGATAALVAAHLWRVRTTGVHGPGADTTEVASPPSPVPVDLPEVYIDSFPHLLLREVLVLQWVLIVLVSLALTGDPPLEELANPLQTPDPVKAPWYFAGLQELLHYFPPFVAGALVPAIVIGLLVVAPFVGLRERSLPAGYPRRRLVRWFTALVLAVTTLLTLVQAWVALIPTTAVELLMLWSTRPGPRANGVRGWLSERSFLEWIVIWLVTVGVALMLTGTFLRGTGGLLVWPTAPWK